MRSIILTSLAAFAFAGASQGADLPSRYPVKAPPPVVAPVPYTGFYLGIIGGGAFADRQTQFVTAPGVASGDIWPAGGIFGITTGYGVSLGSAILKFEADWQYSFNRQGGQCGAVVFQCNVQDSFLFDQGVWLGLPWGAVTGAVQSGSRLPPPSQWPIPIPPLPSSGWAASIMPKIGGGISERNVKVVQVDALGASAADQAWLFGWWAGVGVDMPIAAGWTAGVEWKYRGFNKSFIPDNSVALFGPFAQQFNHLNEQSIVFKVSTSLSPF